MYILPLISHSRLIKITGGETTKRKEMNFTTIRNSMNTFLTNVKVTCTKALQHLKLALAIMFRDAAELLDPSPNIKWTGHSMVRLDDGEYVFISGSAGRKLFYYDGEEDSLTADVPPEKISAAWTRNVDTYKPMFPTVYGNWQKMKSFWSL